MARTLRQRLVALLSTLLCLPLAHAQVEAPPVLPGRSGYAVDWPGILAQQRIFGLAHGVRLLAAACEARQDAAAAAAYGQWLATQKAPIETARRELAAYYFGADTTSVEEHAIASAMHLKPVLAGRSASALAAACSSLPEALARPRYDLGRLIELQRQLIEFGAATDLAARGDACLAQSPPALFARLSQHLDAWQTRNAAALERTRAALAQRWQEANVELTLAAWTDARKKHATREKTDCAKFADWLDTPAASPDYDFIRRP